MDARTLLAKTLQAEAGNQGLQGMIDVGAVIQNRLNSGGYGDTLSDVIMSPGQFSAWNSETGYAGGEQGQDMDFVPNKMAFQAADAVLSGEFDNRVGDATNYFAIIPDKSPAPRWADNSFVKLGAHYFGTAGAGDGPFVPSGEDEMADNRVSTLYNFAQDSDNKASDQMSFLLKFGGSENAQAGVVNEYVPPEAQPRTTPPSFYNKPGAQNQPQPAQGTQLGFGAGVPRAAQGEPLPPRLSFSPEVFERPPQSNEGGIVPNKAVAPTFSASGAGQTGAEEPQSFVDKIANSLFKNSENPRQKLSDLVGGLAESFGNLGNISGGAQVSAYPGNRIAMIAQRKADAAEQAAKLAQQRYEAAKDSDVSDRAERRLALDAEIARQNAAIARSAENRELRKEDRELAAANYANNPVQFYDDASIQQFQADEELAPLVPLLLRGNREESAKAANDIAEILSERAAALHGPSVGDAYAKAYKLKNAQTPENEQAFFDSLRGLSGPEIKGVFDATDITPAVTDFVRKFGILAEGDPEKVRVLRELASIAPEAEAARIEAQLARGDEIQREFDTARENYADIETELNRMSPILDEIIYFDGDTTAVPTPITDLLGGVAVTLDGLGFDEAGSIVEDAIGMSAENYAKMNQLDKYLVFLMTKDLTEAQGTITDTERRGVAEASFTGALPTETRRHLINKLKTKGMITRAKSDAYRERAGSLYQHTQEAENFSRATIGDATAAVKQAMDNLSRIRDDSLQSHPWTVRLRKLTADMEAGKELSQEDLDYIDRQRRASSPHLTPEQARYIAPYLAAEGFGYYVEKGTNEIKKVPRGPVRAPTLDTNVVTPTIEPIPAGRDYIPFGQVMRHPLLGVASNINTALYNSNLNDNIDEAVEDEYNASRQKPETNKQEPRDLSDWVLNLIGAGKDFADEVSDELER